MGSAVVTKDLIRTALALVLLCGCAAAQRSVLQTDGDPADTTDATVDAVLHSMVGHAGVIFLGTVLDVQRVSPSAEGATGVVQVVFSVDRGIRGAATGSRYDLREWAGLWVGNDDRFRVGQRLLLLLHAPGPGGLSSPVGGMDGAIPIRAGANAAAEPLVDLRWVAARVSRGPVQYRAEMPRIPRARAMAEVLHLPGEITPVVEASAAAVAKDQNSVAAQCASVSSVVAAIVRWGTEPR